MHLLCLQFDGQTISFLTEYKHNTQFLLKCFHFEHFLCRKHTKDLHSWDLDFSSEFNEGKLELTNSFSSNASETFAILMSLTFPLSNL
jgi:hypothetical protein